MDNTMRKILESTYTGRMTVYHFEDVELLTGETRQEKVIVLENIPCALSQSQLKPVKIAESNSHSQKEYLAKLFLAPDIKLEAGSEITVLQDGMNYHFKYSGESFVYPTHQEIMIAREDYA